jgi:outer membrane lipopolysaccharide assembly protein LptE/RlpB
MSNVEGMNSIDSWGLKRQSATRRKRLRCANDSILKVMAFSGNERDDWAIMMKKEWTLLPALAVMLLLIVACGYGFPGSGGKLPGGVSSIYIENFDNRTVELAIENLFTSSFITIFRQRNKNLIAREPQSADAVFKGVVASESISTIVATQAQTAQERRVTMGLNLKLIDQKGKVLWAADGVSDNEAYPVTADNEETELNKRAAIGVLSQRIAQRVYNQLTANF